jgi:hypothetical protein
MNYQPFYAYGVYRLILYGDVSENKASESKK